MPGTGPGMTSLILERPVSRTRVEDRDRAAVLRPAGDVVTHRYRTLLAVGDRAHTVGLNAARGQIVAYGLRPAGAECDVVFTRAALVGVAFDGELAVLRISRQPLRLLVERGARLRRQLGRIGFEKHAVADIDHEVLLAARRRQAGGVCLRIIIRLVGACRYRQCRGQNGREPGAA